MAAERSHVFADLLRASRRAAGLTQEELAERAGMSVRALRNLESGTSQTPRRDTIALLAAALGLGKTEQAAFAQAARRPQSHPGAQILQRAADVAAPPLVGRVRELARLGRHMAGEDPPLLLLAGEPGIGKTRLLQEAAIRAHEAGWSVLAGGCTRRSGQEPYAPLLAALARFLAARTNARLRADLEGCAWLVRLLPELAERAVVPAPRWALPPDQERRLMFDAVERTLANVTGPAGTLVLLDDLQWAGPDALDLLAALARSAQPAPPQRPMRLLGAYRSTEVDGSTPLDALIADLAREDLVDDMALGPLASEESRQLLTVLLADTGEADRERTTGRLLARAGGVPFFLVSCAREAAVHPSTADVELPWTVQQSLRQRVAGLPEAARRLLGLAAVAGRELPRSVLLVAGEEALAVDRATLLGAIEAACAAGLLAEDDQGDYRFAHDLVRDAVLAGLGAARKATWHQVWAEALERSPGEPPIAQLAYHYARSDEPEKAIRYLQQAGDQARALYAHAEAAVYFQDLVAWLDRLGRAHEAAHGREQLGQVLDRAAHYDQAVEVLDRAAETYRVVGDLDGLARVTAHIGWMRAGHGSPSEAISRIRQLLETQGASLPATGQAALYAALARLHLVCDQYTEQQIAAETAATLARSVNASGILVQAELQRGLALLNLGHVAEAYQALEAVIPLAEATDDLWVLCFALGSASVAHTARGAFDDASRYIARALECAELIGDPAVTADLLQRRGTNAIFLGRWDQARADLEQALRMLAQGTPAFAQLYPLLGLGRLCLNTGEQEAAHLYLQQSIALAERSGNLYGLRAVHLALAEQDLLEGRPASACARLEPLLDRLGSEEGDVTRLLPILGWAYLELGNEEQTEAMQTQAWVRASREQIRPVMVDTLRVRALADMRRGRWAEAERALDELLVQCQAMPYPYAEAKGLYVYGQLLAARGEPERARERYEAALAICQRLGEALYRPHIERALA